MNQDAPFDDRKPRILITRFSIFDPCVLEYESGLSDSPADPSGNAPFLRQLTSSTATPPEATSTPQRSMQMPSQLQFQSNLLDQDMDMQDAMRDFDSYDGDSGPSQRPCRLHYLS